MKRNQTNRPHNVYVFEGHGEDDTYWTRVGAAWPHKDGKGFNVQLTALPLSGRLVVREPKPKEDQQ